MSNRLPTPNRPERQKGQALVEFALISPILLIALMAIMDFSHVILTYVQGVGALREATRYAEVVGYIADGGGLPSYLDCAGMEAAARKVILVDDQVISIIYIKKDNVTTYTCDTVSADLLENGDMLRITSTARVDFFTPLITTMLPSVQMNFRGQRTIIKDITLGLSYDVDSDFDGLLDSWELLWFGDLSHIATENLDSDQCNLGCEESRLLDPYNPDTDGDGLQDHEEAYYYETDGNDIDTDDDSLTTPTVFDLNDYIEINTLRDFSDQPADSPDVSICYTSPILPDTDGDGLTDGEELTYIFNGEAKPLNPCDLDTDNDGLQDYDEYIRDTDGTSKDSDGDGLEDRDEIEIYLTNPLDPDSDSDTLTDGAEVLTDWPYPLTTDTPTCQTDPNDSDTDNDTITDDVELYLMLLNPCDPDWDNDLLLDGEEAGFQGDPKLADTDSDGLTDWIEATTLYPDALGVMKRCLLLADLDQDTDNDGASDFFEYDYDDYTVLNPCIYDTDGNGLSDGDQHTGTNIDSDQDGLKDSWEIIYFGNITLYNGSNDPDGDGLTNTQEHPINTGTVNYPGTNPMVKDTDSDNLQDNVEYTTVFDLNPTNNLDPNAADTDLDGLYDGYNTFTNIGENRIPAPYAACTTNPTVQDSDGDNISDSSELTTTWSSIVNTPPQSAPQSETFVLNPCAPDTDGDNLYDGINTGTGLGEMLYTNPAYQSCKTHPNRTDTDSDGLSDSAEITAGTNPCHNDTDLDGLPDGLEIALKTVYPTLSATDSDSDDDNFTDYDEYCDRKAGTDVPSGYANPKAVCTAVDDPAWDTSPIVPDTDGDGRKDGDERKESIELFYITDPMVADTDGDGVNDGQEMTNGTKPNNKITVNITATTTVIEAEKSSSDPLPQTITVTVTNNNGASANTTSGSVEAITLYWKTTQGSALISPYGIAVSGTDFRAVTGTVATGINPITIPANTASFTLTVYTLGDNNSADNNKNEYFYIDILYPGDSFGTTTTKRLTNAALGTSRGFVIIDDQDS